MPYKDPQVQRDYMRAYGRQWAKRNPLRVAEKTKRWRAAHIDEVRARDRDSYRRRREVRLPQMRALYWGRVEERREASRQWMKANPEKHVLQVARRRARKIGASGSHSIEQWNALLEKCGRRCTYCGRNDIGLTRDHVIPLTRGGSDDISNIVPSCRSCNSRKGTKTREEFAA